MKISRSIYSAKSEARVQFKLAIVSFCLEEYSKCLWLESRWWTTWRKAENTTFLPLTQLLLWTWNEHTANGYRTNNRIFFLLQITEKKVLQMLKTCTANSTHTSCTSLLFTSLTRFTYFSRPSGFRYVLPCSRPCARVASVSLKRHI